MLTRVYCETNRYGTKLWWWKILDSKEPSHGPFVKRDEARDAARAAKVAAQSETRDALVNNISILSAG